MSLTFDTLREANRRRQLEWPGNDEIDTAFRTIEIAGEGGELVAAVEEHLLTSLNALAVAGHLGKVSEQMKKYLRAQCGIKGSKADLEAIGDEIGDTIIALDLFAKEIGIDMGSVTARKFNKTSAKYDLHTRLPEGEEEEAPSHCEGCVKPINEGDPYFPYSDGVDACGDCAPLISDVIRNNEDMLEDEELSPEDREDYQDSLALMKKRLEEEGDVKVTFPHP